MLPVDAAFALDPRLAADTLVVGDLEFSRVLLMDDARFPWLILVPRRAGLRDVIDLARDGQHQLQDEIDRCARVLHALERPDKLNIAALGNVVAQLHVHVVARFVHDTAWPRPVWGIGERVPYSVAALDARIAALRTALHFAAAA
ncbi:MAG: HIT domain-containing protein [Rudaea sp.]|nr:HIT domain-containing protein [Rudaea sp.]